MKQRTGPESELREGRSEGRCEAMQGIRMGGMVRVMYFEVWRGVAM